MTVNQPRTLAASSRRSGMLGRLERINLRTKLIAGFVLVAAFTTAVVGYSINRTLQTELTNNVSQNLNTQARALALTMGNELEKQIELLKTLEQDGTLLTALEEANARYQGDPTAIQAQIKQLDQAWLAAVAANNNQDPLIKDVLSNEAAQKLKLFRLLYVDHAEVFITDKYGALLASTNRTSDYNQADEDWWQAGSNAIYLGQPEYDESSRIFAVNIALPVKDANARVIGVLRSTYRVSMLVQSVASARRGETSRASLLFPNNELIDAGGARFTIDAETRTKVLAISESFDQFEFNGNDRLITQAPLISSATEKNLIRNLGWVLVIDQDPNEITHPIAEAARNVLSIGLVTLVIAIFLGAVATQYLAAPITRLTAVASQIRAGDLKARARVDTQDEIGTLADTLNAMTSELQETLQDLEQRVAERTTDLEQRSTELADRTVQLELANIRAQKRAAQFQAIAQVGKAITSIQNLDELLPYITQVASQQLGYYHVGIFMFDANKEYAILMAANSEGGQRMLERGHKLKVGREGIVGYVASLGRPRIALDTGADAIYFDNPDLPETHSELALPLTIGPKTIGVLDVQSEQPSAFEQEDIELLTIMAEQVSLAIQNAQRFEETRKAMSDVEAISKQYLRREWQSIAKESQNLGYRLTKNKLEPLTKQTEAPDVMEVLRSGQTKLVKERAQSRLTIPVKLRGEVIAVLNLESNGDRPWKSDIVDIAQAISDRIALAVENARLLESSQNQATRERTVGEITAKIGASVNLRNVLQTAVEELGRILPGADVVIQIESASKNTQS